MFNKSYHTRASRRGDLQSLGQILDELVRRAGPGPGFYRPKRRPWLGVAAKDCKKRNGELRGVQLELFGNNAKPVGNTEKVAVPADRPLFDLFPEAYP